MSNLALALVAVSITIQPDDSWWKQLISYGALGAICIFLVWERVNERKLDRKARHEHAQAIYENTMATHLLSQHVKQLISVVYLFLGKPIPPPEPPTPSPRPKDRHSETG